MHAPRFQDLGCFFFCVCVCLLERENDAPGIGGAKRHLVVFVSFEVSNTYVGILSF